MLDKQMLNEAFDEVHDPFPAQNMRKEMLSSSWLDEFTPSPSQNYLNALETDSVVKNDIKFCKVFHGNMPKCNTDTHAMETGSECYQVEVIKESKDSRLEHIVTLFVAKKSIESNDFDMVLNALTNIFYKLKRLS